MFMTFRMDQYEGLKAGFQMEKMSRVSEACSSFLRIKLNVIHATFASIIKLI